MAGVLKSTASVIAKSKGQNCVDAIHFIEIDLRAYVNLIHIVHKQWLGLCFGKTV